uniref:Uncharacterized protein n=1 Tax=Anguilla anguilla TaxID=7936 RepID=A0A0E9PVP5_ANGAN
MFDWYIIKAMFHDANSQLSPLMLIWEGYAVCWFWSFAAVKCLI